MLHYLLDLVARLGHWAYLVIFVVATLECAAFIGLLVPGESLMLASGFFSQQGSLELDAVMVVGFLGAIVGDNIGYQLGCRLGRAWLLQHGKRFGLKPSRLARAEAFFAHHGTQAVFFGRFIGFARALVPFVAGTSRMPYRQFLVYNGLGAALWSVGFVLLGYFLGASWRVAERWIGRTSLVVAGTVAVVVLATWFWRRHRRRQHETSAYEVR